MNKSPEEILLLLNSKFSSNFESWKRLEEKSLDKTIKSIYTLNAISEILNQKRTHRHHDICIKVFDELIADITSCLYLLTSAMDKPAHLILRRVLELGIASVYLWDMPHVIYSWKNHDQDLSFSEMVKHLTSDGYSDFITNQNCYINNRRIIDSKACQKLYGNLSDIVHGKINSFETDLINRFQFDKDEWLESISTVEKVTNIIIKANILRHNISSEVKSKYPNSIEVIN